MGKRGVVSLSLAVTAGALAVATPGAEAAQPAPPAPAAVSQYVEMVPTAEGSRPLKGKGKTYTLPAATAATIRAKAGGDAAVLEKAATSSTYGAPPPRRRAQRIMPSEAAQIPTAAGLASYARSGSGLDAALSVARTPRGLLILAGLAVTAAAAAVIRRRRATPHTRAD